MLYHACATHATSYINFPNLKKVLKTAFLIANEKLETNKKNIFEARDVASYYDQSKRELKTMTMPL